MIRPAFLLRCQTLRLVVACATATACAVAQGQEAGAPAPAAAVEETAESSSDADVIPVEATETAGSPPIEAADEQDGSFSSSSPASEQGSFFRSSPPPAESSFSIANVSDDAADDVMAAPDAPGMSRFGAPPPFSVPPASESAASNAAPAQATVPPAGPFDTATPAAVPPQTGLPPPSPPNGASAPPGFSAPAAEGTRSVLTSPPEQPASLPASGFGSSPAGLAPPPSQVSGDPAAAGLQEPAAFDASDVGGMASQGGAVVGTSAGNVADAQQPVVLPSGPATMLIDAALEAVEEGSGPAVLVGLASRPLPLLEALERSGDRGRRLWITQAYWKLVEQAAMLRWTAEAAERLDLVAPSADPLDRATLDVAVASRLADVAAARAAVVSAQQELVDLARFPASEPLPWPVDRPLATSYETHFDVLFASRIATGRIRAIHRSLPLEHEEVDARAAAVLAAETAVAMAENDHARGARGIESVIAAHAALLEQQKSLAGAVTRYNDDIVEYVMAVADFSVPDSQFATMLIGTPTPWRPTVALTSAALPAGGSPTLAVPPAAGAAGQPAALNGFPVR